MFLWIASCLCQCHGLGQHDVCVIFLCDFSFTITLLGTPFGDGKFLTHH